MPENFTKTGYDILVDQALYHCDKYYNQDNPDISDAEYDERYTQVLKEIERLHPDWTRPDSPTRNVGGDAKASFQKIKHEVPLLSLNDLFSTDDVISWHDNLSQPIVVVEEKIDGLTIALTYINGMLAQGVTRGDGHIGELVTLQAKQIRGIPHKIKIPPGVDPENKIIIRAEVCQPVLEFERLNREQEAIGEKLFANPRNCAAGGLRAKDPAVTKARGLMAIAFQIIHTEGWSDARTKLPELTDLEIMKSKNMVMTGHFTQKHDVELLKYMGFIPVTQYYCPTQKDILKAIEKIGNDRSTLPYWTDGAVIKTNSQALWNIFGETVKYPLHSVAYKYPAEKKRTIIRKIDVTVGRTGKLIPVAEFDPVQLAGTTVTHATLHNQKFLDDNRINVGCEIEVLKSGEIIPKVVGVPTPAEHPFQITRCPVCGAQAVLSDDSEDAASKVMMCPNMTGCPAQKLRYFQFFVSRDVMDIRGLGNKLLAQLIDAGILNNIWDIYDLHNHVDEMKTLDKIGNKKIQNILSAIEESKHVDIDRVIKSLGIPGIGRHIGKTLAAKYDNISAITRASVEELKSLDGIGEISANAIRNAWDSQEFQERYKMLQVRGVNMTSLRTLQAPNGTIFNGLTFVITGTLPSMTRDEAKEIIERNGGKVSGSVSKKTSYLLAGDAAGSKLEKAQNLGVKIISEDDLQNMLV